MSGLLIVLVSIAAAIYAATFIRVGLIAKTDDGEMYFAATIAGYPISLKRLFGNSDGKVSRTPKPASKPRQRFDIPAFDKVCDIIFDILYKLSGKLTVDKFNLSINVGGPDARVVAMSCGVLTELIGSMIPLLSDFVKIKDSRIVVLPAFATMKSDVDFYGKFTFRIGALSGIAFSALIHYLMLRKGKNNGKNTTGTADGNNDDTDSRDGRRKHHRGISHTDS
ncbi:MAG: DUF2953 domain-containing protein [Oscillospiraceae bacterium]|jgi:hypothetical protein|nr:DUF2953 domain-containing protein [Oscillospiraceae bacterium]